MNFLSLKKPPSINGKFQAKCIICYSVTNEILIPCGHFCLCSNCSIQLFKLRQGPSELNLVIDLNTNNGVQCPICRCTAVPIKVFYLL